MENVYGTSVIGGVERENLKIVGGPALREGEYLTTVRDTTTAASQTAAASTGTITATRTRTGRGTTSIPSASITGMWKG